MRRTKSKQPAGLDRAGEDFSLHTLHFSLEVHDTMGGLRALL
jgi:hypothetical protein